MSQKFKNEKGFTLLEVLLSMSIMIILLPMVAYLMIMVYQSLSNTSAYDDQTNDFRIYTTIIAQDLLYADNIRIEQNEEYEVLFYRTKNGKNKALILDEKQGMLEWDLNKDKKTFITNIKPYDEEKKFLEVFDNNKIRFNVFATDINALMLFSIDSRRNGVYK